MEEKLIELLRKINAHLHNICWYKAMYMSTCYADKWMISVVIDDKGDPLRITASNIKDMILFIEEWMDNKGYER